jgi:hypothetical protein
MNPSPFVEHENTLDHAIENGEFMRAILGNDLLLLLAE